LGTSLVVNGDIQGYDCQIGCIDNPIGH
jgi:hypothetical protein